jgi:proline iminopeptidase
MNKFIFIYALILVPTLAFSYEDGEKFCKNNPVNSFSRFHQIENKIRVHSYTKKVFDRRLPSVLFFTGGPGGSPRSSEFDLENYNVVFFEERGMGCSRAEDIKTFLDPDTYSSLNTAHDTKKVLEDYGIKKAIIYGHSYGTVPATIFGSLFPDMTEKIILEGTIFKGDADIWKSEIKRKFLQDTFDQLDDPIKTKIISYSASGIIPANWFSVVGSLMSYLDNGSEIYQTFLRNVLSMENEIFIGLISTFYAPRGFQENNPSEAMDGDVVFGMLTCKELSGMTSFSNSALHFNQDLKLTWDEGSDFSEKYCEKLGIKENEPVDLSKYPIQVPVVYLAGELDGATDLYQARSHSTYVSKGLKQFYVLQKGGHLPNLGPLKDNRDCRDADDCLAIKSIKTQVKMFEYILASELSSETLNQLNQDLEFKWIRLE